jgi:hypothetical protein
MENDKIKLWQIIIGPLAVVLIILIMSKSHETTPTSTILNECKEDSLRRVISDLQIEIENEEDGWDKKEKRYEQTLFEYEMGLEHLKHYHLTAYKEFHRIIGYKENYSHEVERENKKRLKNGNTVDLWR